jgi:hypothetical protein
VSVSIDAPRTNRWMLRATPTSTPRHDRAHRSDPARALTLGSLARAHLLAGDLPEARAC